MTREKKKVFSTSLVNVRCLLAPARARDGLSSLPALPGPGLASDPASDVHRAWPSL